MVKGDRKLTQNTNTKCPTANGMGRKRSRLEDLRLMAFLHFVGFFIYSAVTSSVHTSGHTKNRFKMQMDEFKKSSRTKLNENTAQKSDQADENQTNDIYYEPNYPKNTRVHNFPTRASEKEMAKHDRYIIHGTLYAETITASPSYIAEHWTIPDNTNNKGPWAFKKKICINITMRNGPIPYINALVMSLMMSHAEGEDKPKLNKNIPAGHRLLSYAELNLLDVERDDGNYDELRMKIKALPFLHNYDVKSFWSRDQRTAMGRNGKLEKIENFLTSARICVKSGLPWCLMMEEFTVVPIDFLDSLKRFVISPLESYVAAHRMESTGESGQRRYRADGEVLREKMSVMSLFSAYNSNTESLMKIHDVQYSRDNYEKHRAKLNSERKAMDEDPHRVEYEMYPIRDVANQVNAHGGYDTAMLFHTSIVKNDLIPMLEKLRMDEMGTWGDMFWNGMKRNPEGIDSNAGTDDNMDLEREFTLYTGIERYRVEPSLVNRIGFYDDNFNGKSYEKELGITNWLTDPRFMFEAGEYWEGIEEFCESETGEWIYDGLHDQRPRTCCDKEEEKSKWCKDEDW